MSELLAFLKRLFEKGEVVLRERPHLDQRGRVPVIEYLTQVHNDLVLEVAGPALSFDEPTALAAAEVTWRACWFLVSHDEPDNVVEAQVQMPAVAAAAATHFSADLTFRFLPQVQSRANAKSPTDVLSMQLETLMRSWPLSGVLSGVTEEPVTSPEFDEHRGLLMLYAERWRRNPKPLWRGTGLTAEYCAWLGQEAATTLPSSPVQQGLA
jgi:MoxR-vWA-beta-propeller ternary system domain bpX4